MYLVAIETTGAFASVALLGAPGTGAGPAGPDESVSPEGPDKSTGPEALHVDVIHGNDRFSHLQNLTPQIDTILKRNHIGMEDIDAIAVSCGPGSFTGIRIGVSTARALSQVMGMPCIAVSSLEALALRAAVRLADGEVHTDLSGLDGVLVCPILDARRTQVYGAGYYLSAGEGARPTSAGEAALPVMEEAVPAGSWLMDEFMEKITDYPKVLFLGDGIDTCRELIEKRGRSGIAFCDQAIRYQDAGTVALRGWQLYKEGKTLEYGKLAPEYMRMAEAERKLLERRAKEKAARQADAQPGTEAAGGPKPGTDAAGDPKSGPEAGR